MPSHYENHLILVDSILMTPLLVVLRLLASDNNDQPPLPDHLENHLILVGLIKVTVQYVT